MNIRFFRRIYREYHFHVKIWISMPRCVCKYESWQHCNNIKDMLSLSISLVESTNHKRNKGIISLFHINPKYLFLSSNFYKTILGYIILFCAKSIKLFCSYVYVHEMNYYLRNNNQTAISSYEQ